MSYNPVPPRVWSRVQNPCTYVDSDNSYNNVYVPVINKTISLAESDYLKKLLYKGNILQHKANSSRLTKKQQYTQIAKGLGPARRKVFATQSQTYTNPNTAGFLRVNYETYNYPNNLVGEPNNISGPFQYNVPNPWDCSSNSIQDGGNLVCGTYADPCSGEIIKTSVNPALICNPTYCSDVPGAPISLCWNSRIQTWFPRVRRTMSNSGTGWPEGYKGFVSALTLDASTLFLTAETTDATVTLSWTYTDSNCIPVTGFNIYQNGILIQTVPNTITTFTIDNIYCVNTFFVTSLSTNIESQPSNIVTISNTPDVPSLSIRTDCNNPTITWNSFESCDYSINIYLNGSLHTNVSASPNSYTFNNLTCDNVIYITIVNGLVESEPSNTVTSYNAPEIPTLTLTYDDTSATLLWSFDTQPTCEYYIDIYQNNNLIFSQKDYNITVFTSYTVENLTCDNEFYIFAVNDTSLLCSSQSNTVISYNIGFTLVNGSFTKNTTSNYYDIRFAIDGVINICSTNYTSMKIILCGGGGGGISANESDLDDRSGGGGGGAQVNQILFENSVHLYNNISVDNSNNIFIGYGGSSGTFNNNGSPGGDTQIQLISTYIAKGGFQGLEQTGGAGGGGAGAGTDGSIITDGFQTIYGGGGGGDGGLGYNGGGGGGAAYDVLNNTLPTSNGGTGGQDGFYGGTGGLNYGGDGGSQSVINGISGTSGGGGGGGFVQDSENVGSGGKGGDGFCIIFLSPII